MPTEPPVLAEPPLPTEEVPNPRQGGEENGRGEEAGRVGEVAKVISYLTVGPDGHRGWAINARRGGAGQKETLADSGRQGLEEGVLEGQKIKEALEVPARDSGCL